MEEQRSSGGERTGGLEREARYGMRMCNKVREGVLWCVFVYWMRERQREREGDEGTVRVREWVGMRMVAVGCLVRVRVLVCGVVCDCVGVVRA